MERRLLVSVLLISVVSWQGLSEDTGDYGDDEENDKESDDCSAGSVRLSTEMGEDQQTTKVTVTRCTRMSEWQYVCDGVWNANEICKYCNNSGCLDQNEYMSQCEVANTRASVINCFGHFNCNSCCLEADCTARSTVNIQPETSTSLQTTPPISTTESETTSQTDSNTPVSTTNSEVMVISSDKNRFTFNLDQLIIIGGAIVGLIAFIVAVIITVVMMVVVYKKCRKRKNLSKERWGKENRSAPTKGEEHHYQEMSALGTLQNGHEESESVHFYHTLQQSYKENAEPCDYEEFQPSVSLSSKSNMPLINKEPEPYEEVVRSGGRVAHEENSDGLYDVIQDPKEIPQSKIRHQVKKDEIQEKSDDSTENHIYFTLEPDT